MTACDTESWDVVICGAGPAGAACALWLRNLQPRWRVLVLEAQEHPRPRPCGEFIAPEGVRLLEEAGVEDLRRADNRLAGLHLHSGPACLRLAFADAQPGIGVRREELGGALLRALSRAGVTVRTGERLQQLHRQAAGWELTSTRMRLQAVLVVGADGRQSRVRHLAGLDRPRQRSRCAVVARIHGLRYPPGGRWGEMHCSPLGQIGVAPLGADEANLNLLLAPRGVWLLKRMPSRLLLRTALQLTPSLRSRSRSCTLSTIMTTPSLPCRARAVVADALALIGDAAGFWDPFTGDGITQALAQAQALAHCLGQVDPAGGIPATALRAYQRRWHALTRSKRSQVLERVLARRALCEGLVGLVGRLPALGRLAAQYMLPSHR